MLYRLLHAITQQLELQPALLDRYYSKYLHEFEFCKNCWIRKLDSSTKASSNQVSGMNMRPYLGCLGNDCEGMPFRVRGSHDDAFTEPKFNIRCTMHYALWRCFY